MRKRRELAPVQDRTARILPNDILLVATVRNERVRLPYFLDYYRALGIGHFLFVDNGSDDGTAALLAGQSDVSVWATGHSYRASRFGTDWINGLLARHGHGHWTLAVDADEFFVYPYCDTRPIRALTDWLDGHGLRSFPVVMVDMYPKASPDAEPYREGQNPFEIARHFDGGNLTVTRNARYGNLWIQGGARARAFFADRPEEAPALNKIPLVRWHRSFAFVNSTHMLLPASLNRVYATHGGEAASGCLLHAKFLSPFDGKVREELERGEHFGGSREYLAYAADASAATTLWTKWSETYLNWRQLEILGLMSKGSWA